MTKVTPVHPGNCIELPAEWAAEFGLSQYAALEKTDRGILVHACSGPAWEELFAEKLVLGPTEETSDAVEVNGDAVVL